LGTFRAREHYGSYSGKEFGDVIRKSVQRAVVEGELLVRAGNSLRDAHEEFSAELDRICTILSLCYRQPVSFYEVKYIASAELDIHPWKRISKVRYKNPRVLEKRTSSELISVRELIDGGFQRLIESMAKSAHRDILSYAISFLSASREASLETAYFMVFASLEAILNISCGENAGPQFSSSRKNLLKAELGATIDRVATRVEAEVMKAKLAELFRQTLEQRTSRALAALQPKTDDLWPGGDVEEGLKCAARIRNGLVHALDLSDPQSVDRNLVRVRTLVERLILKMLQWPDDAVWRWSDDELRWANELGLM
jgi:hypothetical protein